MGLMLRPLASTLLVALALAAPSLCLAESSWSAISGIFDPDSLTDEFADKVDPLRAIFMGIGICFLFYRGARIWSQEESQRVILESNVRLLLGVSIISLLPLWQTKVVIMGEAMADVTGVGDPLDMGKELWKFGAQWRNDESAASEAIEETALESEKAEEDKSWWKKATDWGKDTWSDAMNMGATIVGAINQGIQRLLILVLGLVAFVCLLICSILQLLGLMLQRFLMEIAVTMLPFFISALFFEPLRNQAITFILKTFSLALWPFAWAIGNIGVFWLVGAISKLTADLATGTLTAAGISKVGVPLVTTALPFMAKASVGLLLVGVVAIVIATLANLLLSPMLLSKVLTQGAHMMGTLASASAAGTAIAAGTAASVGAGVVTAGGGAIAGSALQKMGAGMSSKGGIGKAAGGGLQSLAKLVQSSSFQSFAKTAGSAGNVMARSGHLLANTATDGGGFAGRSIGEFASGGVQKGMQGERGARSALTRSILGHLDDSEPAERENSGKAK